MDEDQLGAILNDPEKMQKIMALAQSFQASVPQEPQKDAVPAFSMPDMDPNMLKRLSGLAGQGAIDKNQKNLLNALSPYLSRQRLQRLEKAMRAAKLASVATTFLGGR